MKKSIWIFFLAVLLPSVVLGWLALRSAEEQQIILEKRTAELYQKETENAAGAVRALIDGERRAFDDTVRRVLANKNPQEAAQDFSAALAAAWPRKAVGFALGKEGRLISPSTESARKNAELQKFLLENSAFLCSAMPATVYWVSGDDLNRPDGLRRKNPPESQITLRNPAEPQQRVTLDGNGSKTLPVSVTSNGTNGTNGTNDALPKDLEKAREPARAVVSGASGGAETPRAVPFARTATLDSASALATPASVPAPAVPAPPAPEATERFPPAKAPAPTRAPRPPSGRAMAREKTKAPSDNATPSPSKAVEGTLSLGATNTSAGNATMSGGLPIKDAAEFKASDGAATPATPAKAAETPATRQPIFFGEKKSQTNPNADAASTELRLAQGQQEPQTMARNVAPLRLPEGDNNAVLSRITPSTAKFRTLTAGAKEGVISRFVQDQLDVLFWVRPAQDPDMIFGCLIESDHLSDLWPAVLPAPDPEAIANGSQAEAPPSLCSRCLTTRRVPWRPSRRARPGGIGSGLSWPRRLVKRCPHWEAALYLQRPEQLRESAHSVRRTLTFLIAGALAAIACGGWLVVADARRQLALAQQKTDFVSNVSHELKTPLTSIRMFAELMQSGRPGTVSKHPQYLRIIMVEAERLTRLINNVLDFARIERRQKRFDKKPLDLHGVIGRTWEGHEWRLREAGFSARWEGAPAPYPVIGDEDALAQILVNLLSNAEKYSGERKEVELHSYIDGARVCVSVLDRGVGVPAGEERKIFEAFYRAHDSLSSGIQGSGLGLTLAQRLAREHGGEVLYQAREGGGSNFTLRLPLTPQPSPPMPSL